MGTEISARSVLAGAGSFKGYPDALPPCASPVLFILKNGNGMMSEGGVQDEDQF